jgi:hypothetical protein
LRIDTANYAAFIKLYGDAAVAGTPATIKDVDL